MEVDQRPTLKRRTTVMLPVGLLAEVDRLRADLGVSRSALLAMAAAKFVAETVPVVNPTNRAESLAVIEQAFAGLLNQARESA